MRLTTVSAVLAPLYFNPRIPQGMRPERVRALVCRSAFQSTHSVGNATLFTSFTTAWNTDFNPRIPQGMRPFCILMMPWLRTISIHAFRSECDRNLCEPVKQLTISIHAFRRECDKWRKENKYTAKISIHAFRRECDPIIFLSLPTSLYFNPRIPQGMRPPDGSDT